MLRAYADRLEADEKAEPIYQWQHRPMHHPEYWKDCRNKEEWDHKRNSLPEAVFRIVYTNPSSADAERLAEALRFYADGNHLLLGDPGAWDTVSGEPQNWLCDEAGTATIEDGTVAKQALAAHPAQAQPPAASVPGVSAQAHENAQGALAAQENPNG